jgi:hypothetical protein
VTELVTDAKVPILDRGNIAPSKEYFG